MEKTVHQISKMGDKSSYSVLYVDDNASNLRVFKSSFKKSFNILITDDPYEAISIIDNGDIKVIVTQQNLPDMSGIELLEKVEIDYPYIIKIFLAEFSEIEALKRRLTKCGVYKHIAKPWNFEEMKVALESGVQTYFKSFNPDLEKGLFKKSNEQLVEGGDKLVEDVKSAGMLQKSMLPNDSYLSGQFSEYFLIYEPKNFLSDELLWTTRVNFRHENYLIVSIIKIESKGFAGALKTLFADSILDYLTHDKKIFNAGELAKELTHELEKKGGKVFKSKIRLSICVIDFDSKLIEYYGSSQDMLIFDDKELIRLEGVKNGHNIEIRALPFKKNYTYYLFSRGYCNQENEFGVRFSYEKFEEMIRSAQNKKMSDQKSFYMENLKLWKSDRPLNENITLLGFKIK